MITALVIHPEGTHYPLGLPEAPKLARAIHEIIGGYLEHVPLERGAHMYVNEDGHRLGLQPNIPATDFAKEHGFRFAHYGPGLLGTVVILGAEAEEEADCPPWVLQEWEARDAHRLHD